MGEAANLNPDGFVEGGGLIDDIDITVAEARFDLFDYNGKVVPGVPSLRVEMESEDDEKATQYYSMGKSDDWIPSDDGTQILATGSATSIRMTSNGGIFLKSLVDAGFPADKLGDDISILDGLKCHVIRVPAPKRAGLKRETKKDFEDTILIVSEIRTLPWEKSKPKGAAKGKAAAKKGKASSKAVSKKDEGDASEKAAEVIMGILAEDGTVTKKELPGKLFKALKDDPDRNAIVKIAFDDDFLADGPWTYEDGTLVG